jgi:riboflavin biosynthesis pyrimidine reductase
MLSSIDGKIDGSSLKGVAEGDDYEVTGALLKGDAWICGRTTMELHFAEDKPFISASKRRAGPQPVFVGRRAKSYAVSVDTFGKLNWSGNDVYGDHLICLVSECAPEDYLTMLRGKGISYIVAGKSSLDLSRAVRLLGKHFGIRTLLLEGGGHINGAFLQARLIDEVSLLVAPGIDGRRGIPAVFDGIDPTPTKAVPLKLKSVVQRRNGILWMRYKVVGKRKK